MTPVSSWVLFLLMLVIVRAGEYCENFEGGDLGNFWRQSVRDTGGRWKPSSYLELKKTIPDFPEPASGDTVVYLTPAPSSGYVSARLEMMDSYSFPEGSSLSFRYWLRSKWPGSGTLEVRRIIGSMDESTAILSLTASSGPSNADWMEANVSVPTDDSSFKLLVYGACATSELDNIAIDDIKVCGPADLNQQCLPMTTTTTMMTTTSEPTTPTESTSTPQYTTTTTRAGEYCDDFENGDFGAFWTQGINDYGGQWKPSSYSELKKTIPDFPEPASGDTVVYLTPAPSSGYVSARLEMMDSYSFPEGSSLSFRYWLRSKYLGSGTLEVRRIIGSMDESTAILSLTASSGPSNADWMEANVSVPTDDSSFKLLVYGACATSELDNIAIDDIKVCGPADLNQQCLPMTTTTTMMTTTSEPTTPTESTSTPQYTTTTQQPTTTEETETTTTAETTPSTEPTH